MSELLSAHEFSYDMIDTNTKGIESCVVPLCYQKRGDSVTLFGSSVYISVEGRYFLLTAAHVFIDTPSALLLPREDDFITIPTTDFVADKNDSIDIAVCELASPLSRFQPLSINQFINYRLAPSNMKLIAVGYPGTKTDSFAGSAKSILKKYVSNESDKQTYVDLKATVAENIVIDFDKNKVMSRDAMERTFPNPNGMSGGGLFWMHKEGLLRRTEPKLVGILTRWDARQKKYMVSTQIRAAAKTLEVKFGLREIPSYLSRGVRMRMDSKPK